MQRPQARPSAGHRGARCTFRRTSPLGHTAERGPFSMISTCLAPPGTCSCTFRVYAISDEGAGRPDQGAGGWAWTMDWRSGSGRLPPPLPLLTSPPPPACITRTHPPSHTSIHNLTPSSPLYTNFPLLLREERDRQSPVRPAFWGEGPPCCGLW